MIPLIHSFFVLTSADQVLPANGLVHVERVVLNWCHTSGQTSQGIELLVVVPVHPPADGNLNVCPLDCDIEFLEVCMYGCGWLKKVLMD